MTLKDKIKLLSENRDQVAKEPDRYTFVDHEELRYFVDDELRQTLEKLLAQEGVNYGARG